MSKKRKKNGKNNTKKITINKYHISFSLISIGIIYFFTLSTANDSPLHLIMAIPTNLIFGETGTYIVFLLLILLGIIILFKEEVLKKNIFKKTFILMLFIGSILNFQILDEGFSTDLITEKGGYLSYGLLRIADKIFGHQIGAIKITFIVLTILSIIWIILTLKIRFKPVKFELNISEKAKISKKDDEKINTKDNKSIQTIIQEAKSKNENPIQNNNDIIDKQMIKTIIKEKINKKFDEKTKEKEFKKIEYPKDKPTFDINLLDEPYNISNYDIDESYLTKNAQAIQNKLEEFGIQVALEGFNIGPSVIQIKIKPDPGVKIAKIEGLKKDLSLALKTKSLRVLAPIPGTGTVGIEIPNPKPRIIRLRELLGSADFSKCMSKNLTNLTVGVGIDSKYKIFSLEKMPHLLVAGATGSGKSVGVNDFILSLIYQNTPAEMKFIMVDPKQVELGIYEGLPYLLAPIITESDKAVKVLKWAAMHMDERYSMLKKAKVRNIEEYNEKMNEENKLYRIVLIIDELADLMMSGNKKDNEITITRIAQKARAVGIHLLLATQRPSVNVVTGLIKANIPSRIAFGVAQQVDSRTILDQKGAEDLVGRGDLLYIDPNNKFPIRIQAPFVDTLETEKVVNYLKEKYMKGISEEQIYHPEIINILTAKTEIAGQGSEVSGDDEELVQKATDLIIDTRKASATLLQRKLGVGFARASRIMDILEERGIVGPQDGAKPREILI